MTEPALAHFLLDRFAEDEAMALEEQKSRDEWHREVQEQAARGVSFGVVVNPYSEPGAPGDPARVLAECQAKRQLIAETQKFDAEIKYDAYGAEPTYEHLILSHLALPFADHPDYREEFKP